MHIDDEYVNRMATTAGWGLTVDWDQPLCRLKKINVSILESMDCSSFKQSVLHIPSEFQICVGHGKSRLGPCMGDVGGPLMRSRDDKRLEIIGKSFQLDSNHLTLITKIIRLNIFLIILKS